MKVSVLVPIYGVEQYIAQCAESLFCQTYEDIEYLFVDDCTPDKSISILSEVSARYPHRQQQMQIIHHEKNKGLGAARLTALQSATGDYVMHVDSDDELPLDAVKLLAEKAQETKSDIIDGGYAMMCQGKITERHEPYQGSKESFLKLMLCQNIVLSMVWGRLYRRTLYTDYQVFPVPGIDYAEDLGLVPRLYFHASRACVKEVVYHYRDDNATSYTNVTMSEKAKQSFLKANALVFDFYQKHDQQGIYRFPLEIGYASMLRTARRNDISKEQVDAECQFCPRFLVTRLLAKTMRSRIPLAVCSFFYRSLRKMYAIRVCCPS